MEENKREREQLSALMDGELSAEELKQLLLTMEQQPELKAQWAAHHAIRHTLFEKRPCIAAGSNRIAGRVSAALQNEATVLAPSNNRVKALRRPWIPLVLAASLATVTFLLIQQPQIAQVPQMAENSVQTEWVEVDGEWVERWVNPLDKQAWMRSYLVRHDENRGSALVSTAPHLSDPQQQLRVAKRIVGWQVGWLPEGFREVDTLQHEIPAFGGSVTHLVLSNGESVFSVFIEKSGAKGESKRKMKGEKHPVNLYSHSTLGHRITVLGEVPMEVVRKVALSVEARSG